MGSAVLVSLKTASMPLTRQNDAIVCRFGGSEFILSTGLHSGDSGFCRGTHEGCGIRDAVSKRSRDSLSAGVAALADQKISQPGAADLAMHRR